MEELTLMLFGEGSKLTVAQMVNRAIGVFALAIALLRVSGRRSLGQQVPYDLCTTILMGAVLSRAVVGASPFWPALAAAAAVAVLHRLVAYAACHWTWMDHLLNGRERELILRGRLNRSELRRALITENDLKAAVRQRTGHEDLSAVYRAVMERDGTLTVHANEPAAP